MKATAAIALIFTAAFLWTCQTAVSDDEQQHAEEELMKAGAEITQSVGSTLMQTVQKHMSESGVEGALEFCQANALPITDSLARKHDVTIKRTAFRTRNPENDPTEFELKVLSNMKGQDIYEPAISYTEEGNPVYYEPIVLKDFCQTCHGVPGQSMTIETDSLIKAHYPNDEATGFSSGDLRGMWVITFDEDAGR